MHHLRYIFIFFIISCGGGSGGSSIIDIENSPSITSFNSSN